MTESIKGSYPGGPRRSGDPGGSRPPRIRPVEELEEARARGSLGSARRARRRRAVWGLVACVVLAFSLGTALGLASHDTRDSVIERREAQGRRDVDISAEVNRTLLQLWKMEDIEAARGRGMIR